MDFGGVFEYYPTKRAVTLPALHLVQHTYGWIPMQAIQEVAEFLELAPAEVLDTATFYEEYWLKPKGKYLIQVCRSWISSRMALRLPCWMWRSPPWMILRLFAEVAEPKSDFSTKQTSKPRSAASHAMQAP